MLSIKQNVILECGQWNVWEAGDVLRLHVIYQVKLKCFYTSCAYLEILSCCLRSLIMFIMWSEDFNDTINDDGWIALKLSVKLAAGCFRTEKACTRQAIHILLWNIADLYPILCILLLISLVCFIEACACVGAHPYISQ